MTKSGAFARGVSIGLLACASALPASALAQTNSAAARSPATDAGAGKAAKPGGAAAATGNLDMRLWSFGDCNKNFPYVDSPEHRECLRVVGSDEAKDARAIYFCSVSHAKDPAEATRCKETYFANKSEAEQEGFRSRMTNPAPTAAAPAVAAPPKRDKDAEIAALTRALKTIDPEVAAPETAPDPAAAPAPAASSGSISNVLLGLGIFLLLAVMGLRYMRNLALSSAAAESAVRRSRSKKTSSGIHFAR